MREKLKNQPLRLLTFRYSVEHVQVLQVYKFFSSQKKKKKSRIFFQQFRQMFRNSSKLQKLESKQMKKHREGVVEDV